MPPRRVILIRHGETDWNLARRFQGHVGPGLNAKGESQAVAVAALLAGEEVSSIFTSDLTKAVETGRHIGAVHGVSVKMEPLLREINFGVWEGLTFGEIQAQCPKVLEDWLQDPFARRVSGGETAGELGERVIWAWNKILQNAKSAQTVMIVDHAGPLQMLLCHLTGLDLSRQWEFRIGHGEPVFLIKSGSKYRILDN
ncbi:MAG: histidine phosphatase family protein [Syntrophomonadaceae bacterium]|nr:histidine phosphatase family protein [Syntrophomonadaceae bacterium]